MLMLRSFFAYVIVGARDRLVDRTGLELFFNIAYYLIKVNRLGLFM